MKPGILAVTCGAILWIGAGILAQAAVFTNDTVIGPLQTNYDGLDIVVSNCTLTIDGPHSFSTLQLVGGARLTHTIPTDGTLPQLIANEPCLLSGTNAVLLAHSNISTSTLHVMDASGVLTIYSNRFDYVLTEGPNTVVQIQRTENSAIPDGSTVLAIYSFTVSPRVDLLIAGDMKVAPDSRIDVSSRGYGGNQGPGSGSRAGSPVASGSGGGHGGDGGYGGDGGLNLTNPIGGHANGLLTNPTSLGSGGGTGVGGLGGAGGGAVRLIIAGSLVNDGTIVANGENATNNRSGGGAGGSIRIAAQTFSGSGSVSANGGNGELPQGGGGGGGRIAIEFETNSFTGTISAIGGNGYQRGGAGAVFLKPTVMNGLVLLDNAGFFGARTPLAVNNGSDVEIRNGAAALAGQSQIRNLVVLSNASCSTSNSVTVNVSGDARIVEGGRLTSDGLGYGPNQGTGRGSYSSSTNASGGGYGGIGGSGFNGSPAGGLAYAGIWPDKPGSGGGATSSRYGGSGGGFVQLKVAGTLTIDGSVSANGTSASGPGGGGGSGGGVWLTAATLVGKGTISANGGNGSMPYCGGGGGGCIRLDLQTNLFSGSISAFGGAGGNRGGAGTILVKTANQTYGNLLVDNGGYEGARTAVGGKFDDLEIRGRAIAWVPSSVDSRGNVTIHSNAWLLLTNRYVSVTVSSNAIVAQGSGICADGLTNCLAQGLGGGYSYSSNGVTYYGGGGHGGRGGGAGGGSSYGNAIPSYDKAGDGASQFSTNAGTGGGLLFLTVTGTLALDGVISANGLSGRSGAGGGSGGTIAISAGKVIGSGLISANGGDGALPTGTGGGGGRIAVTSQSNVFSGLICAYGGGGAETGGAGTVCLRTNENDAGRIFVDNNGRIGNYTTFTTSLVPDLELRSGAIVNLPSSVQTVRQLVVQSNAVLTTSNVLTLSASNVLVAACGIVSVDSLGYPANQGTGHGFSTSTNAGGGGGYGGYGGNGSSSGASGGIAYGSITAPIDRGSGGGYYPYSSNAFTGGGAIRLTISGTLTVNGKLSADGTSAAKAGAGGGSGGSIWLTVANLAGSGTISANGGSAFITNSGGGGGGRIAVFYATNTFSGVISACGGLGYSRGGAGTIYLSNTRTGQSGTVILDNMGNGGGYSPVPNISYTDVMLTNGAIMMVSSSTTIQSLTVNSGSKVCFTNLNSTLNVTRDLTVCAGGFLGADGFGCPANTGAGRGFSSGSGFGSGGGYGGCGGDTSDSTAKGGVSYGSAINPTSYGSGGGCYSSAAIASCGGGAVRLNVSRSLIVDGMLSANGTQAATPGAGGGSGGSVWITAQTLKGAGTISANGGAALGYYGGGGGGGRVAIYYATNLFAGTVSANGGSGVGALNGGAGTVYLKSNSESGGRLLVDNAGISGEGTPLPDSSGLPTVPFTLSIANGGSVNWSNSIWPVLENLIVKAGGLVTSTTNGLPIDLAILRDVDLQPGGVISFDGKGYSQGSGPGAGATLYAQGAGGSYGGRGGASASGAYSGLTYGSVTRPTDSGSGGGSGWGPVYPGSQGGGAIRLAVGGHLNVNGSLTANGNNASQDDAGGGAGGSLWITASNLTGNGVITADGGCGDLFGGGGGGGGRIAIYAPMNTFTGLVSVAGGDGAHPGHNGSVLVSGNLPALEVTSQAPSGIVTNAVTQLALDFSDRLDPESVSATDVALATPTGILSQSNITVSVSPSNPYRLNVTFSSRLNHPGVYAVQVGPAITNLFGGSMEQVYTGSFDVLLTLISGTVGSVDGQPIPGWDLNTPGLLHVKFQPDAYEFELPANWTGTLAPQAPGAAFVPASRSYTNVSGWLADQNFVGIVPPALSTAVSGTNLSLTWAGTGPLTYQVMCSTNLPNWSPYGAPFSASNTAIQLTFPIETNCQRFFRVVVQP